jgi:hypothetical protein
VFTLDSIYLLSSWCAFQARELHALQLDTSVRRCLLAVGQEDQERFTELIEMLEPGSAEELDLGGQQETNPLAQAVFDAGGEETPDPAEGEYDASEEYGALSRGTFAFGLHGEATLLLRHIVLQVDEFAVALGVQTYSWMSMHLVGVSLDFSEWETGAINFEAKIQVCLEACTEHSSVVHG